MKPLGHEMILASAGTGKTHRLTTRYIRLLALGAPPERIVALTFTRKSAGEFFDRILSRLADATRSPKAAAALAKDIDAPHFDQAAFLRLLRGMIDAMPRLALGTLDSFFARIVRSFPFELGLGGDFEVIEGHAVDLERRRVLERIFASTGRELDRTQLDFIEAFKRATFGLEVKKLSSLLDTYITENHALLLRAPDADAWGNAARIWPRGTEWLEPGTRSAADVLRAWVQTADIAEKQRIRWLNFLESFDAWSPGVSIDAPMKYLLPKAIDEWKALGDGTAVLEFDRKKQTLSPAACVALRSLVHVVVSGELNRHLEITRGMHAILSTYENLYHDDVRRAGRLTFTDVQRLLLPSTGAPLLGLGADADDDEAQQRLLIDWRLDGQFDHWLLDEFQDTSHEQWTVLENLIDEVVQDNSGQRSFFYVGDVKQAIYAWRGGDARLFREIFDRYGGGKPGGIIADKLDDSFRSGPPIIDFVNTVFGDAAAFESVFGGSAAERWNGEWSTHRTQRLDRAGQAAWLVADENEDRQMKTLRVLQQIEPLRRGLSAAVLVRNNQQATELTDFLRREGNLPVVGEASLHIGTDNPLTSAVVSLFKVAAHPDDTLAREHVRMSPLESVLVAEELTAADAISRTILRQIHDDGFEVATSYWCARLAPHLDKDDAFSRERARQFIEAARIFDTRGGREIAEFVEFIEGYTIGEPNAQSVIRVMTLHKSKGLDFDVVVLPEIESTSLAKRPAGIVVTTDADRNVQWVLDLPSALFCDADPTLARRVVEASAEACYEALALLYVGTTRAKHALYVITDAPKSSSTSNNYTKLLATTLGDTVGEIAVGDAMFPGIWSSGAPHWYATSKPGTPEAPPPDIPAPDARALTRIERLQARTPSRHRAGRLTGTALFASGSDAASFGLAVHAELASVEWWQPQDGDAWVTARQHAGSAPAAIAAARGCLDAPEFSDVFRPAAHGRSVEVWRERAFEIAHDGAWITGTFDRVLVERDATGVARHATVFDFKTDRVGRDPHEWQAAADRHAHQMRLYRVAASTLLRLAPGDVTIAVVLTGAVDADGGRAAPVVLT